HCDCRRKCSADRESHVVPAHRLGMTRENLPDLDLRIRFTRKGEFPQPPNRTRRESEMALAGTTGTDVVLDELSFAFRQLFDERPVDQRAKSLVILHGNPPPRMRISKPPGRGRFWTSPLSSGRPGPEPSRRETGLLETSAATPRDTAV